ncbi:MAG: hypothetical protein IT416_01495 [Candidatus Pacebacteria bacterium]|nr:hypothetical protein [Candidatus Paceibacterota bacterium]
MNKTIAATLDLSGAAQGNLPGAVSADPQKNFRTLLGGLMGGIMVIAAVMVLIFLLWGAIEWITSGGDKGKTEAARNKITQAIIGLIVLAATTAIFMLLQNFLGICVLSFDGSC